MIIWSIYTMWRNYAGMMRLDLILVPSFWAAVAIVFVGTLIGISRGITISESIRMAEERKLAYYPGDLLLAGLFPFHTDYNETTGVCSKIAELDGIIPLEAVMYLLDEVNRANILSFRLGFIAFDTCDSHSFTLEQALQVIHSHASESNSGNECPKKDGSKEAVFDVHKVVGLVTGLASSVTISLAQLTRLFQLPQISFLSTSPLLSDKRRYDYFFRTVPSDVNQVAAIVEILKFYKWNHVSIVYADDEYGNRALHELEQLSSKNSLCFAAKVKIPAEWRAIMTTPYDLMVEKLVHGKTEVIIIFADVKYLTRFFDAILRHRNRQLRKPLPQREPSDFILIGSDAWGGREETINEYPEIKEGLITVQLNTREISQFAHHYMNLVPSESICERNPFYCKLWRQCHDHGKSPNMQNQVVADATSHDFNPRVRGLSYNPCMLATTDSMSFLNIDNLRDAIYAYVYALKNMHTAKCGGTSGLCDTMRTVKGSDLKLFLTNVSFTEPDGTTFRFHDGSEGIPRYAILNLQRQTNHSDGSIQFRFVEVGKYTQDTDQKATLVLNRTATRFRENKPVYPSQTPCMPYCDPSANEVQSARVDTSCCWKCVKCEPWQYPNNQQCVNCPAGSVASASLEYYGEFYLGFSLASFNTCVPLEPTFLDYHSIYAIPVLAFSAAGILATLISGLVMLAYKSTPIVKAAGREHLGLLLLGVTASYAMNFVILWQPSPWSCFVVRFIGACYAVCNCTVLIKIARIYRIFNTKESRKTQKLKYISPKSQVALTLGFVFVELVIVTVWMAFDWPHVLQLYPSHLETELVCSDLHDLKLLSGLCYPLMLLFPMAYFAFRTRTCPAAFAEARHTGYGIYLTFINVLTFVLIYIGNNSVRIRVLTVCIGLCLNASVLLVSTFFTKAYLVLFRPHKNSKDCIMNSSRSFGGKYATSGSVATDGNSSHCAACKTLLTGVMSTAITISGTHSSTDLRQAKSTSDLVEDLTPKPDIDEAPSLPHALERSKSCCGAQKHWKSNGHHLAYIPPAHLASDNHAL